jgi:hypothetical protein
VAQAELGIDEERGQDHIEESPGHEALHQGLGIAFRAQAGTQKQGQHGEGHACEEGVQVLPGERAPRRGGVLEGEVEGKQEGIEAEEDREDAEAHPDDLTQGILGAVDLPRPDGTGQHRGGAGSEAVEYREDQVKEGEAVVEDRHALFHPEPADIDPVHDIEQHVGHHPDHHREGHAEQVRKDWAGG